MTDERTLEILRYDPLVAFLLGKEPEPFALEPVQMFHYEDVKMPDGMTVRKPVLDLPGSTPSASKGA